MNSVNLTVFLLLTRTNLHARQSVQCLIDSATLFSSVSNFIVSAYPSAYSLNIDKSPYFQLRVREYACSSLFQHISLCVSECSTKYVLFLHDDDIFLPDFVATVIRESQSGSFFSCFSSSYISSMADIIYCKKAASLVHRNRSPFNLNQEDIIDSYVYGSFTGKRIIFPTAMYNTRLLRKFFATSSPHLGIHSDVLIIYSLSSSGCRLIDCRNSFFYRLHDLQMSSDRTALSSIRLLVWIKSLRINKQISALTYRLFVLRYLIFNWRPKNLFAYFVVSRLRALLVFARSSVAHSISLFDN